jgi:hypothetical protein
MVYIWWSMIFSENRKALFRIMLWRTRPVVSVVIAALDPQSAMHAEPHFGMDHRAFATPKRLRPRRRVESGGDEE